LSTHDVGLVVRHVEVEDLHDVGMPQGGHGLRLRAETVARGFFFGEEAVQNLHRHRAMERGVLAEIDLRHPAAPEAFPNLHFGERAPNPVCHDAAPNDASGL
jgi:hypothetical protein